MKTVATLLAAVALLSSCSPERRSSTPPADGAQSGGGRLRIQPVSETVPSPAGPAAAQPFLSATSDALLLSWTEAAPDGRAAVRFARYGSGGWSEARTVVERDDLFVNWADFPSIVEDATGVLYAHWLQKSGKGTYAYDVRMSTSADGGKSWSEPFLLNRDGVEGEHGFVSLLPAAGGGVEAVWLDGRKMSGGDHGHGGGDMTMRHARVAADGTLSGDAEIEPRTCECCTTGMAASSQGLVVVYRDRSAEEIRDIGVVTGGADGWSPPRMVARDGWKIAGCPVNGPQVDALGERVAVAWFTEAGGVPRVRLAFSRDGGASFAAPVTVDDGHPLGRADVVMLADGSAVVAWLEKTAGGAEIRARKFEEAGRGGESLRIAASSSARAAGFVRAARVGDELWFAWNGQGNEKGIRLARARF